MKEITSGQSYLEKPKVRRLSKNATNELQIVEGRFPGKKLPFPLQIADHLQSDLVVLLPCPSEVQDIVYELGPVDHMDGMIILAVQSLNQKFPVLGIVVDLIRRRKLVVKDYPLIGSWQIVNGLGNTFQNQSYGQLG